jgi:hypothetical protein
MKKLFNIMLFALFSSLLFAQKCEFPMAVIISNEANITASSRDMLDARLRQIITSKGVSAGNNNFQFAIFANPILSSKDIIASAPTQISQEVELVIGIADLYNQRIFSTEIITLRGIDRSEEKAFISAIKTLNAKNIQLSNLVEKSQKEIIEYYDNNADFILKEAKSLSSLHQYEKALFSLIQIPTCCKHYNKVMDEAIKIYNDYLNYDCEVALLQAKNLWAAEPTESNAIYVIDLLSTINPRSECSKDVETFIQEVKKQVRSDIDFETREKYHDEVKLKTLAIEAIQKVGVAFGNNQQPTTTNWLFK